MLLSEGQLNDHRGAALLAHSLPPARALIADRGYDSDRFRITLRQAGITPCIPPRKNRKVQHAYDATLYRQRHHIENCFAKLKDWRRVATRYDRCADIFMAAVTIAAIIIFWLKK
jgi:transposase